MPYACSPQPVSTTDRERLRQDISLVSDAVRFRSGQLRPLGLVAFLSVTSSVSQSHILRSFGRDVVTLSRRVARCLALKLELTDALELKYPASDITGSVESSEYVESVKKPEEAAMGEEMGLSRADIDLEATTASSSSSKKSILLPSEGTSRLIVRGKGKNPLWGGNWREEIDDCTVTVLESSTGLAISCQKKRV